MTPAVCETPVTHVLPDRGRVPNMEIVSDLRIICFIHEHVHSVPNVLEASVTDVLCPQTFYGKIKLLEFSVKGLRMPGVINIRNRSVCNPMSSVLFLQHL